MDGKELGELSSIGIEQINEFGERYFSNLNFNSFYNLSAHDLYERDFTEFFNKNTLYVIIGTDSGLLPHYIKQKGLPDGSRYIFIEPSAILEQLLQVNALTINESNFAFADENSWLDVIDEFNGRNYFYINSVFTRYAYCAREESLTGYTELCWYVAEKVNQLNYEHQTTIGTEQFVVQQIMNLADNQHAAFPLLDAFNGKTAFVLGGGPSLDEVLPWLLLNRSKVFVLAVSRISKRLLDVGIEPDFIFSVDPFPPNFAVSKEIYNFSANPILIHSPMVCHRLLSQWQGRSLFLEHRCIWSSSLNEDNLYQQPPTVSNAAIAVALQMGFSRIFLAGIDLCYTKDGFTHAQGSNEYVAGARFNLTGAEVLTYDETLSPTGLDYRYARDLLEQQVSVVESKRLFNIALHAAKVENIDYMPLAAIELDREDVDVNAIVTPLLNKDSDTNYFHALHQELDKSLYHFKEIKTLASKALRYNDELYSDDGTINDYQIKQRLDKLEKQLDKKHGTFCKIVKAFGLKKFMRFITPSDEIRQVSTSEERIELARELKERLDIYYGCYLEGSQSLIQLVELVKKILIAREEEKKQTPNWDLIIDACQEEQAYGRAYIWDKLESAQQLSPKQQASVNEYKEKFQASLLSMQSSHLQLVKGQNNLVLLNQRASSLFKHKQKEGLTNLWFALEKQEEPEKVAPYRLLIQGYMAELEGQHEQALQFYQEVLELGTGPLKEALLRILHLDYQEEANTGLGLLALECLAQLDPRYQVFYAEGLRINGKITAAINEYVKYLTIFPEDWQSSLNLAEIFYQQKIYEGAHLLVAQVLAKHPSQKSALLLKQKLAELS